MTDDHPDPAPDPEHDALPPYVRALLSPDAYPHRPPVVSLVQTHISYVFLADDLVYKTKKPVNFGFIDQVAFEAREHHARQEVTLNRRLAPEVYLDVVPVVRRAGGGFAVDVPLEPGDAIEEWAVKMRRLPDDRTLDRLIGADTVAPDLPARIASRLVEFHARARVVENDPSFAGAEGVRNWWTREYREAEGNIGGTWRADDALHLREGVAAFLSREAALFDERLVAGRVVEGHGDLHAKHIYDLGPRPEDLVIVDCIEFTEWFHFRYLDAGYDLAFLAMDLEARGPADLGDEVAGRYLAATADETLGVLQPLHRAFRAFVRGKVESIGANAPEVPAPQRAELAASAAGYFRLATEVLRRRAEPVLVILCGLSGTGKSVAGATLATRIGAAYVSSDAVRKRLAGVPPHEHGAEGVLYTDEMSERTYVEMRRLAAHHLALGRPVVLDGVHARAADRQAARQVARDVDVPSLLVSLELTEASALARIEARQADPHAISDATPEVYRRQVATFEPVNSTEGSYLAVDADQTLSRVVDEMVGALPD
ncbi:MAG: AAA family ATPase [Chloroflexi bacterium]|nr:AAA family ATPase [Chloroflexota bacterium]MDA1240367.1 AAA family ATPase [Chloroflexota bacterium]